MSAIEVVCVGFTIGLLVLLWVIVSLGADLQAAREEIRRLKAQR